MLCIAEYNPFFIKKTFNLPEYKPKQKKRVIVEYDNLFYELFNTINKRDINHIDHIDHNSKFNEKQEKFKIAAEVEKCIKLKSKDKDAIIQNLMYENKINLKTLNALCLFYKINLLYVKDNIFITMYFGSDNYCMINDKIRELDLNTLELSKKYNVCLDKPLRCMSYYKIDDLRLISEQLHLPTENIKKQQLYDSISNVLSKLNI